MCSLAKLFERRDSCQPSASEPTIRDRSGKQEQVETIPGGQAPGLSYYQPRYLVSMLET